ncbi:alkaline phosphatase family protein [Thermodesulfobacteriota bacterium]
MSTIKKIILLLLDGLGDRSYGALNGRTPLQAAETPHLDHLAGLGGNGLYHASTPGQCLPSETAHYLLFGYDLKTFPGRGLLEAVGAEIPFQENDVLCLAHLSEVTMVEGVPVLTGGRKDIEGSREELGSLYASIGSFEWEGVACQLHQTGRNDGILVLSGEVSPHITDSDPMIPNMAIARIFPVEPNPEPGKADTTARALNAYLSHCYHVLDAHNENHLRRERRLRAANFLTTQRCGRRILQEPFADLWGMTGMMIASGLMYKGLAQELGFTFRQVKDSSDPGGDLRERINMALTDDSHQFVHVHTKVADQAAHSGDPMGKQEVITAVDRGLDGLVKALKVRDDILVVITADHSTPSQSPLIHSGEPVPLSMVGHGVRRDRVKAFDEVSAATGCLGLLRGKDLILSILNCADRSVLLGHRLGESEKPYISSSYAPFKIAD